MDTEEAREFTEALSQSGAGLFRQIALGMRLGVPQSLDLTNQEWREQVAGGIKLAIPERQKQAAELVGEGYTESEAAEALDVSQPTISRDLSAIQNEYPQSPDTSPDQGEPDEVADGPIQNEYDVSPEQDQQESVLDEPADDQPEPPAPKPKPMITLYTHEGTPVDYPEPQGKVSFNQTPGEGISWASWSWNPVTGCLHGCKYCYARELATSERLAKSYPAGFTPLFHPERLDAPASTTIPAQHRDDSHEPCGSGECDICAYRRVFVCSMADLYGRWVPDEWIDKVHASMLASPQWEYILLTKFPSRYNKVELPSTAWVGTSVDDQRRVPIAEDAFRKIDGVKVKWLSLEPLLSPLEFTDLSMFDWVVIGAQTETRQPDGPVPAFQPPWEWVLDITQQAREAGCKVHWKPNLHHGPGMVWPNEYPVS